MRLRSNRDHRLRIGWIRLIGGTGGGGTRRSRVSAAEGSPETANLGRPGLVLDGFWTGSTSAGWVIHSDTRNKGSGLGWGSRQCRAAVAGDLAGAERAGRTGGKNYCQSVRVHVLSECKPEPASRGGRCALPRISPRRRMARAAEERRWPCTGGKGTLRPRLTSVTGAGERVGAHRAFEPKKKGRRRARRRRPAARWAQTSWSSRRRAPQDSWSPRIGSTGPCGDDAGDQRCR